MKIFVSQSLHPEDKNIVEQIKRFISDSIKGVKLISKEPKWADVWSEIEKTINKCQGAIGILTKGIKIDGKEEWRTRGWLLTETTYCLGKEYPTLAFVEKGISDLGIIGVKEYISFFRNKNGKLEFEQGKENAIKLLRSVFIPFPRSYIFDSMEWKVQIFKDGHGINEKTITLYIPPEAKFERVKHVFGFGPLMSTRFKLPSFLEMKKTDYHQRYDQYTVFGRIIEDKKIKRKIYLEEESLESTEQKKVFYIRFLPNLKAGERIKYGWGWSCPKLYFMKKSSLTRNKKYDDETVISTTHPTSRLSIEIFFEEGFSISGLPWIEITDLSGNPIKGEKIGEEKRLSFNSVPGLYGKKFSREFSFVHQNACYKVRWKIKKIKGRKINK